MARRGSFGVIACVGAALGCGGRPLDSAGGGVGPAVSDQVPMDGRCALSPRLLVAASTYPSPADEEVGRLGVWRLVPAGGDLFYETYAIGAGRAGVYLAGSLMRVPVTGGAPVLIDSGHVFSSLVVTDTTLFVERDNAYPFTDDNDVVSIPRGGGDPTTLFTFADVNDTPIGEIVLDGDILYVPSTAAVRAIPLAAPSSVVTVRSPGANGIQVSGGRLVMAVQDADLRGIESVALPYRGEAPHVLQTDLSVVPQDLVQCGSRVCWAAEDTNSIVQVSPEVGPVSKVVTMPPGFGAIASLVFDGTSFFVSSINDTNDGIGQIARVPAAALGQPETIETPGDGGAFGVDDECVYWTTADGIYSVAKTVSAPVGQ